MKNLLALAVFVFLFSCTYTNPNEKVFNGYDIVFSIMDNESNELEIGIRANVNLTNRSVTKLEREYGTNYKDNFLIPTVQRITRTNLKEYSPGEIYNYKRPEIEQRIINQTTAAYDSAGVELTKLFISTVKVPEDLMKRLEQEHIEMMKDKN